MAFLPRSFPKTTTSIACLAGLAIASVAACNDTTSEPSFIGGGTPPTAGAGGTSGGSGGSTTAAGNGGAKAGGGITIGNAGSAGNTNAGSSGNTNAGAAQGGSAGHAAGATQGGSAGQNGAGAAGKGGAPAAGTSAAGASGSAGAGEGGSNVGGSGGSDVGGSAGAATGGSGGAETGGAGGAAPAVTRLRFVVLSENLLEDPVDVCYGQNLTNPDGDDPGYIGPVGKLFNGTIVSPTMTKYISDGAATPLVADKPIVLRVVKPFTDCTKANRVLGANDDKTHMIVGGADNTVALFDSNTSLGALLTADLATSTTVAGIRIFSGVQKQPIDVSYEKSGDATFTPVATVDFAQLHDLTFAPGLANVLIDVAGDTANGVNVGQTNFHVGTTYSVLTTGDDNPIPAIVYGSVCEDDKANAALNAFGATCTFTPNPEGGD